MKLNYSPIYKTAEKKLLRESTDANTMEFLLTKLQYSHSSQAMFIDNLVIYKLFLL